MTTNQLIPAAQYVRMSTEHQQYSLENQSTAIRTYAESHGFEVVRTYSDAAKSGIVLKHRTGLGQLLRDVVSGTAAYQAILVYDVSRWGRFQDTDESAHYEFLCESAGVPVHYCAETFANDGSLPSLIMKSLKRTMAGEYSRELGVKVLAGQKRLACLGFRQGSRPGYGLRRMLVSADGQRRQILSDGEQKSIATDRVILVPGPPHEVQVIHDIYRMFISEKKRVKAITQELISREIPYIGPHKWNRYAVSRILSHPRYVGMHVFGRTSRKLHTPMVKLPQSEWVVKPEAFEPIVDAETFADAQTILQNHTINRSNAQVLDCLRKILHKEGRVTLDLIKNSPDTPCPSTYRKRFGGLLQAYELIGYRASRQSEFIAARRQITTLREGLMAQIVGTFPTRVSIIKRNRKCRSRLRLQDGLMVSVLVARAFNPWKNTLRWQIEPVSRESRSVTLFVRLAEGNRSILDIHVFPGIGCNRKFRVSLMDPWFNGGKRLDELWRTLELVAWARAARKGNLWKLRK